eukprot:4293113-Pyramimonas_sp.AAC.1
MALSCETSSYFTQDSCSRLSLLRDLRHSSSVPRPSDPLVGARPPDLPGRVRPPDTPGRVRQFTRLDARQSDLTYRSTRSSSPPVRLALR